MSSLYYFHKGMRSNNNYYKAKYSVEKFKTVNSVSFVFSNVN